MKTSDQINELAAALVKAQGQMKPAPKDAVNPHFRSKYADLASVWDAARGPLTANGLAVIQGASAEGTAVTVTTRLLHTSGQWIEEALTTVAKDPGPQAIGSCLSYGRRYGLSALIGITAEDDDGEAATARNGNGYTVNAPSPAIAQPTGIGKRFETLVAHAAGLLYVKAVNSTPTRNPNVTKYTITFSTGETASTIKSPLAAIAEQACQDARPVDMTTKETKYGQELVSLHFADHDHDEPELTDSDIPFVWLLPLVLPLLLSAGAWA